MTESKEKLVTEALEDPDEVYRVSMKASDAVGLALVGILDHDLPGTRAAGRFEAFTVAQGPGALTSELALVILERADVVSEELAQAALAYVRELGAKLPLNTGQAKRVAAIVRNQEHNEERRMRLLFWLWQARGNEVRQISAHLLNDPTERYTAVVQQAMIIEGYFQDDPGRAPLRAYAERQFVPSQADQTSSQPEPRAALYALNVLKRVTASDLNLILEVLSRAAHVNLLVKKDLEQLFKRLTVDQLRVIIERMVEDGHVTWLSQALLPSLLTARGADLAPTVSEEWWPEQCVSGFAIFDWEVLDDRLYVTVLKALHRTEHEPARLAIRRSILNRCGETTPDGAGRMPRLGARALLEVSLQGDIEPNDQHLLAVLQGLGAEALVEEVGRVRWKKTMRSGRLAAVIGQVAPDLIPRVFVMALDAGRETALGFVEGAPVSVLDAHAGDLVDAADEEEAVLHRLCVLSEAAADLTLERWERDHSLVPFRALAESSRAEGRLEHVPTAVRLYTDVSPAARTELLQALDTNGERLGLLVDILSDRANPPGSRPANEDLINAMGLLGEHLREGADPESALVPLSAICREAPKPAVRRAAYAALEQATPTPSLVDLLLERLRGEVQGLRPAVRDALSRTADRLDSRAQRLDTSDRAHAVSQLARIDPERAVVHARDLVTADDANDRRVAAEILGNTGTDEDAGLIEEAIQGEPNLEVRDQMHRAIRRLRIGDQAAAHERLGELAGINTPSWLTLHPTDVYGNWADPLVKGLDRVAKAEINKDWGTAIDQLDEVAKALLLRAVEIRGAGIGFSPGDIAKAQTNSLDYGGVLARQQVLQNWPWVHHLASLHQLRTEHITPKGKVVAQEERTAGDWMTAQSYFKLGSLKCCELIVDTSL